MRKLSLRIAFAMTTAFFATEAIAENTFNMNNSNPMMSVDIDDYEATTENSSNVVNAGNAIIINNGSMNNSNPTMIFKADDVEFHTENSTGVANALNYIGQMPGSN